MFRFPTRFRPEGRERPQPSPTRFAPALAPLERRELLSFAITEIHAQPDILYPPNGRYVTVQVSGTAIEYHYNGKTTIFAAESGAKNGNFQVVDLFHRDQPQGPVTPVYIGGGKYTFSFTTQLQASGASSIASGRHYYISVGFHDVDGWGGKTVAVWVPNSLSKAYISTHLASLLPAGSA